MSKPSRFSILNIMRMVHRTARFIHPQSQEEVESPEQLATNAVRFGMWSLLLIFGIFGLWAAIAPLESAAIATGQVVLDSNKKTIQHLEGGIIEKILVREGQSVTKGEPLVILDETAAKAKFDLLKSQSVAVRALHARLLSERDDKDEIAFPSDLLQAEKEGDEITIEQLDSQRRLFISHKKSADGKIAILEQKAKQYKQEINGLSSQVSSSSRQINLLNQEINVVSKLLAKGNASKPRLLALKRQASALSGQRGEYKAQISRAKQSIAEVGIEKLNLKNQFLNEVVAELKETQTQVADITERMRASSDTVARITIAAPISGMVTGLKVHTVGGVIAAGAEVMDIIPQDDKLIVEAKVNPQDIDVIRSGLKARVRLSAYKARQVPLILGNVVNVSADSFVDKHTGMPYYNARIEISAEAMQEVGDNIKLYPGMPTEVLIITGSRSFLSYLFTPITESFNRAFREE